MKYKFTLDTITDQNIEELRWEAARAGDVNMVAMCRLALSGEVDAILACVNAINDARAQNDAR